MSSDSSRDLDQGHLVQMRAAHLIPGNRLPLRSIRPRRFKVPLRPVHPSSDSQSALAPARHLCRPTRLLHPKRQHLHISTSQGRTLPRKSLHLSRVRSRPRARRRMHRKTSPRAPRARAKRPNEPQHKPPPPPPPPSRIRPLLHLCRGRRSA
ncbi:hypothetical protein OH77DRAFT_730837 [Trametes cingulata]|nr:hypothetical protein OH77DRAFT_730837 [Trametes cingulata]